jgi:ribonuclease Y
MSGLGYAAIGAAFVLGLLFIQAYSRRGSAGNSADVHGRHGEPAVGAGVVAGIDAEAARAEIEEARERAARDVESVLANARRTAEAEASRREEQLRRTEHELAARARELDARAAELRDDGMAADRAIRQLDGRRADLDAAEAALSARAEELDVRAGELDARAAELTAREDQLDARAREHDLELERLAGLTADEAKLELMAAVEAGARRDAAVLVRSIESEARSEGTERARAIVAEAVQRVASGQTSESVVSVLHLPSEEMKGRIIGREGRNIRAFESTTGVNVIIDDTPEAVLLSCFDPVRREVGRLTLDRLVLDGRIHPNRIEEAYEQSRAEVDELCLRAARDALADVGIHDLDERLIPTIGRLKYRTSYGQNVLGHLIETAHVAGVMAAELGVEPTLVKRCAFLHDIGKALTHEVEGSHAIVGAELLRKYGESEAVAHAVEAHHNEVQPRTVEAVLTQASDTCSAARPGARRESLENYVKRLARIEEIATAKEGVEKVFAMQSGREVRVMVQPSEVDDLAASVIAREIAKQIEDELTYPGQIRVTVVRESRTTEIAH